MGNSRKKRVAQSKNKGKVNSAKKKTTKKKMDNKELPQELNDNKQNLNFLSNRIPFSVLLRVNSAGLGFIGISSSTFPWLMQDYRIQDSLKEAINKGIYKCGKSKISYNCLNLNLSSGIKIALETYEIRTLPELNITIEEHSPSALKILRQDTGMMTILLYREKVLRDTKIISSRDIKVKMPEGGLHFGLDTSNHRTIKVVVENDIFVSGVSVKHSMKVIAEKEVDCIFKAGIDNVLQLPVIPVKYYKGMTKESKVNIVLTMSDGRQIEGKVNCTIPTIKNTYVSWFLDMGSTKVKAFKFEWSESADYCIGKKNPSRIFQNLTENAKVIAVESFDTYKFIEKFKLPEYDKAKLVEMGDRAYSKWIESCVFKLSSDLLLKGELLFSAHISMPKVDGISIEKVQEMTRAEVKPFLLDSVYLVYEHNALRERFSHALALMAIFASKEKAIIDKMKKKNQEKKTAKDTHQRKFSREKAEYDSRGWLARLFHRDPRKPDYSMYAPGKVPTLLQWHEKMLRIDADSELSEVIILDAGGYSLDVFARINNKEYGQSFKAGGVHLTRMVKQRIDEEEGGITLTGAEQRKIDFCTKMYGIGDKEKIGEFTEIIYREPIRQLLNWIKKTAENKSIGVPMILSGGGFNNPYLIDILIATLKRNGILIEPMTSSDLTGIIEGSTLGSKNSLRNFMMITYRFSPDNYPNISHDICGGMIEKYTGKLSGEEHNE